MKNKAIFLDRDGTLIEDAGYPNDPEQVQLIPGAAEALQTFSHADYMLTSARADEQPCPCHPADTDKAYSTPIIYPGLSWIYRETPSVNWNEFLGTYVMLISGHDGTILLDENGDPILDELGEPIRIKESTYIHCHDPSKYSSDSIPDEEQFLSGWDAGMRIDY